MAVKPGWEGRFFEDFEVGDVYRCRLGSDRHGGGQYLVYFVDE